MDGATIRFRKTNIATFISGIGMLGCGSGYSGAIWEQNSGGLEL